MKLQRYENYEYQRFGWLVHQIISLYEVLKLKQNYLKTEVVTGKTPFSVHLVLLILFVLTMTFDKTVLYGNIAFSILVFSTKEQYSCFLRKVFVFEKIDFKVKLLKTFKIFSDCHIKTCRSLKRRAILKTLAPYFRRTYVFLLPLK